ncbi:hypothetical protein BDB01DRAFT_734017 [Pilobolus umbonatus]|nr:hypothetical protein BDB01DRAFT_734017 [Pilobolus umbonatus]
MMQLAILGAPHKPVDLDSFLAPLVEELMSLSTNGMIVKRAGVEVCKARVHLMAATGDIIGVQELMHHTGSNSWDGCRLCKVVGEHPDNYNHGMYFVKTNAALRSREEFIQGDGHGLRKPSIFSQLPSFSGGPFFGLDEMHLIGGGISKLILEMITVDNETNSRTRSKFFYIDQDGDKISDNYPFFISRSDLVKIATIPVSFQGGWENIINKSAGVRMVDYVDFLLYAVPTIVCPFIRDRATCKALIALSTACSLALQWNITEQMIQQMEKCFQIWHKYLQTQISNKRLSKSVFSPVNHYLHHIAYITKSLGPMRAYSTRPMERTIGKYARMIKSRVDSGVNAGNIFERIAIRNLVNMYVNIEDEVDIIAPKPYNDSTFIDHPSRHPNNPQLWSPFLETPLNLLELDTADDICGNPVTNQTILDHLQHYYFTHNHHPIVSNYNIQPAGRAWINHSMFSSCMNRKKMNEFRRGNHHVMFEAHHTDSRNTIRTSWFVGTVIFFFSHLHLDQDHHLVFIELAKTNSSASYDNNIPTITLRQLDEAPSLAVIDILDITAQVGLVKSPKLANTYSFISPYYSFNRNMSTNGGKISLL